MSAESYFICPICNTQWLRTLRRAGMRCGDLSQGQRRPCVGRLVPRHQFRAAEWRRPAAVYRDALSKRFKEAVCAWGNGPGPCPTPDMGTYVTAAWVLMEDQPRRPGVSVDDLEHLAEVIGFPRDEIFTRSLFDDPEVVS